MQGQRFFSCSLLRAAFMSSGEATHINVAGSYQRLCVSLFHSTIVSYMYFFFSLRNTCNFSSKWAISLLHLLVVAYHLHRLVVAYHLHRLVVAYHHQYSFPFCNWSHYPRLC